MQLRPFVAEMRAKVPVSELPGTRDPVAMVGTHHQGRRYQGTVSRCFRQCIPFTCVKCGKIVQVLWLFFSPKRIKRCELFGLNE